MRVMGKFCNSDYIFLGSARFFRGRRLDPEDVAAGFGSASSILRPALLSRSPSELSIAHEVGKPMFAEGKVKHCRSQPWPKFCTT